MPADPTAPIPPPPPQIPTALDALRHRQVQRLELQLSYLLRTGVIISTTLVLIGLALMFHHHREYFSGNVSAQTVARDLVFPHTIAEVLTGLAQGEGRALIIAGIFALIATPVLRVAASVLVFWHQRDHLFTAITIIVLAMLLLSFALGRAGG